MRKYSKRTKSTSSKTYKEYLQWRKEEEAKGIVLKNKLNEDQFYNEYEMLRQAKREGEIKSQPWQELKKRERYVASAKVAKNLLIAQKEMLKDEYREKISLAEDEKEIKALQKELRALQKEQTLSNIFKQSPNALAAAFKFIQENKKSGLFGGDYE